MGPYCKYCDHRCFVHDPKRSGYILATCNKGMENDRRVLGYDVVMARAEVQQAPPPLTPALVPAVAPGPMSAEEARAEVTELVESAHTEFCSTGRCDCASLPDRICTALAGGAS